MNRNPVRVKNLPCPVCKNPTPVSRAKARIVCSKCGATLRAVKVKHSYPRAH